MHRSQIPSLNWLRVFEAAARHQSLARAAEELAMSPSAVSQQVRALEEHFGEKLFRRTANRVTLSPSGEAFLPAVTLSLSTLETKATSLFRSPGTVRITLEASSLMAMSWLPRRLAAFEAEHPKIRVDLRTDETNSLAASPVEQPDLEVRFGMDADFAPSARKLMGVRHSVVARRDIAEKTKTLDDLLSLRLFDVASHAVGWPQLLNQLAGVQATRRPDIVALDSTPIAFMMAAEGLGFAIKHAPVCDALVTALDLAPCTLIPEMQGIGHYHMMLRGSGRLEPAAALLEEFLWNDAAG